MSSNYDNKVSLFKKESVYGTDAAPTAAADAVLTRNAKVSPVKADNVDRPLDLPSWGKPPSYRSNLRREFSFEMELAGSGTANAAPAWMKVLEVCGFAAGAIQTTPPSVTQSPITGDGSSGTLYLNIDDYFMKVLGARGDWSMSFEAGNVPFIGVQGIGLLPSGAAVTKQAAPVPDFTAWKVPLLVETANTNFLLDGYAPALKSLSIKGGMTVTKRKLVGQNAVSLGGRAVTGDLVIEAPDPAVKDYITLAANNTPMVLSVAHGVAVGQIVTLTIPKAVLGEPEFDSDGGKLTIKFPFEAQIASGNDEILITTK